ncbi:hypothetical protein EYR36_003212 [Pleurotus pulmonarius]|nr:hypothetical protein EYR36_003212 [Pleurotus pulmonarius]
MPADAPRDTKLSDRTRSTGGSSVPPLEVNSNRHDQPTDASTSQPLIHPTTSAQPPASVPGLSSSGDAVLQQSIDSAARRRLFLRVLGGKKERLWLPPVAFNQAFYSPSPQASASAPDFSSARDEILQHAISSTSSGEASQSLPSAGNWEMYARKVGLPPNSNWQCLWKLDVKRHIETSHLMIKRFTCEICDKTFAKKAGFDAHKNEHTGKTPFGCNYDGCGQAFKDTSARQRHHIEEHGHTPKPVKTRFKVNIA